MTVSVIISTRNRSRNIRSVLDSISKQTLPYKCFEVLVVDNGSSDDTIQLLNSYSNALPNFRFFFEKDPGLHTCRHKGLKESRKDILVYADDDIEASPTWLEGIFESFEDKDVSLVCGKCAPHFDSEPPKWILDMWRHNRNGNRVLGYLSLLDLGNEIKEISPHHVFGCNFSIRKSTLLEAGGFHPDAFPKDLIHFRGDGESHVSNFIQSRKLKTVYNPKASVYHRVPNERMTIEYFCYRAFIQGISDSYAAVRRSNGRVLFSERHSGISKLMQRFSYVLSTIKEKGGFEILHMISRRINALSDLGNSQKTSRRKRMSLSYKAGVDFHQFMVRKHPAMLEWVLRKDYFGENGKIPHIHIANDIIAQAQAILDDKFAL